MYERPHMAGFECKEETMTFLDKNENPFRLPPSLREQIRQVVSDIDLNRYPDPDARALKQVLSKITGIP
ncbi:MAG: histidinol-phosphate aminotransferase, partial [Synergistaceae bacterium]|nr:histidinol-phosphate aminotransferase [Synergistaceae bacterium]